MYRTPDRHPQQQQRRRRQDRKSAYQVLAETCRPVVESLEPRQLMAGYSVERVSVADDGSALTAASGMSLVSADGRYVAFRSAAENLLANGADQHLLTDVFATDLAAVPQAEVTGTPDGSNPQVVASKSNDPNAGPLTANGTDFGIVDVGDADGVEHTFTITNTGSDRLIFGGTAFIGISGANKDDFVVTAQPTYPNGGTALDPGDSVTFTVRFKPLGVGIRTATVTFTSNDGTTPTYSFDLSGTTTDVSNASRVVITQGATTVPTGTGTPYAFGNLPLNSAPKVVTFTVTNVSGQTLTLDSLSLTANNGFEIVTSFAPTIAPGQTTTFSLRLNATTAGPAAATVNFSNTVGGDARAVTFDVSATITVPQISVSAGSTNLTKGQTFDFGPVVKGAAAVTKTFTITNTGQAPLTIGTVSVPAGYVVDSKPSDPIAPGGTGTLTIRLDSASSAGTKNGTLSIVTNDPDANPYTLSLTGSILAPTLSVSLNGTTLTGGAAAAPFGSVNQNQADVTKTFTITNTGTAPLNISPPTLPTGFTLVSAPASTLAPGASTSIVVRLTTTTVRSYSGNLSILTNDSLHNPFNIALSATVVALAAKAVLLVNGAAVGGQAISFGTVPQGSAPVTKTITVRNDGNINLLLGAITLPAGYTVASAPGTATVAPGASTTFTVSFTPAVAGSQTGVLLVATNEAGRTAVSAGITASVTAAGKTALAVDAVALAKVPAIVLSGTRSARGTATVTLRNYSSATVAGSYKITVYAAAGAFARPGVDRVLGTANAKVNLKAHAKSGYAVKLSFPAPPADAAYNIVAVVTGPEADPAFNFNRAPFKVRIEKAQAKLGATGGAAPVSGSLGQKITQTVMLSNSGNRPLSGTITGDLYLSKDGTLDGAAKITTLSGVKIHVGSRKAQRVRLSFTLPKAAPAGIAAKGKYTLVFKITKLASSTSNVLNKDGVVPAGRITLT